MFWIFFGNSLFQRSLEVDINDRPDDITLKSSGCFYSPDSFLKFLLWLLIFCSTAKFFREYFWVAYQHTDINPCRVCAL